jgi:hypothetical protein
MNRCKFLSEKGSFRISELPFNSNANFRFWLVEELSDDHWLNVNKDTKPDVSFGLSNDK